VLAVALFKLVVMVAEKMLEMVEQEQVQILILLAVKQVQVV
jgi:hypothetical protein|tara:strand:+ start:259 stop:381 length:123 start_codon:yes stop_codon:yes gene_type:complete